MKDAHDGEGLTLLLAHGRKALAVLLALPSGLSACCDCAAPGISIHSSCDTVWDQIDRIELSGSCAGDTLKRRQQWEEGNRGYYITPTRPGLCHVKVVFLDGATFERDVQVWETNALQCCPGIHGQDVEVPCSDAGL